jgi:hypothetical protein
VLEGFKTEIIEHYMDRGLVTRDRDPSIDSTGNGLLHAGLFYGILYQLGEITSEDVSRFCQTVQPCMKEYGLLKRSPTKTDLESRDDYVGVCAASFLMHTSHAEMILKYGSEHNWSYNNEPMPFQIGSPFAWIRHKWSAWHGKFVGIPAFYRCSSKEPLSNLDEWLLTQHIKLDTKSDDISGKMMTLLMSWVARGPKIDPALALWRKKFNDTYGTVGKMLSIPFGENHPFARVRLKA